MGTWKYKATIGGELILDFGHEENGIGSGSDQIAPSVGIGFMRGKTTLIPLVQHFWDYDGPDVNTTALRLIAIQSLPNEMWGKIDAKVPIDWEHDNAIPATVELQLGKMCSPSLGTYVEGLAGIGGDKPYNWGVGVGVRFSY